MEYNDPKVIKKIRKQKEVIEIDCEWGKVNKVNVNPDGQVLPCCYFANTHFYNKHVPNIGKDFINHPVMLDYKKHEKEGAVRIAQTAATAKAESQLAHAAPGQHLALLIAAGETEKAVP